MDYVPSGSCEKIEITGFLGGGKCLRNSRMPLISDLNDKFVPAKPLGIAEINFFTRSCPRFPVMSTTLRQL